jgi:predicted CXXCH cytochrome family protein
VRRRTLILAIGLSALAVTGCDIEKHYDTLSFFFDGVPDPNAVEPEAPADRRALTGGQSPGARSSHLAYVERRCTDCHGAASRTPFRAGGFNQLDQRVCLECHEEETSGYPYVHGPVAIGECLLCHKPHDSPNLHLLVEPPATLCLGCHEMKAEPPHDDLERSCLDCHHGHGGDHPYFLRPVEAPAEMIEDPEPVESREG